ncbi:MAG TPA: PspA/IM30 family protein [Candidatus Dormibacteraeota bacterium]|jgi:phage shock protein A
MLLWLGVQLGLADEVEDPREALDLAYARQLELQSRARRAVADVVTARKRVELQTRSLAPTVAKLEEQARTAVREGRQEAAREALTWRTALAGELAELERQIGSLAEEEARLRQAASRLELRVHQLRVRRDALRASYAAARARVEVGQLLAEVRDGDSELLQAVQEAENRVTRTRALADALQGQTATRALRAASAEPGPPGSAVWRSDAEVADEMARMEEELLWGPRAREEREREGGA